MKGAPEVSESEKVCQVMYTIAIIGDLGIRSAQAPGSALSSDRRMDS